MTKKLKVEINYQKQECLVITEEIVSSIITRIEKSLIEKLQEEMEFRVSD